MDNNTDADDVVAEDKEKWRLADWIVRQQWVYRLIDYHQKILKGNASPAEQDMFWIKLNGLIREFEAPMKDSIKGLEMALDINSSLYRHITNSEERDILSSKIREILSVEREFVGYVNHAIHIINNIYKAFDQNDLVFLLDQRTHAAHPTADFYKFKLAKNGQLQDQFNGLSKNDIQRILRDEYLKHKGESNTLTASCNAAIYYARKINKCDLEEILSDIRNISRIINPISVLF